MVEERGLVGARYGYCFKPWNRQSKEQNLQQNTEHQNAPLEMVHLLGVGSVNQ